MYYLVLEGKQVGPYSLEQLQGFWQARQVGPETPFWREGMAAWQPLKDLQAELTPTAQPRWPAGFWVRAFACIIDFILLGILGGIMGLFLARPFEQMGNVGPLVGYLMAVVYFGILNSGTGGGRTLGKRLFKLEVVNREGKHLPLSRSILRAVIFAIPGFWNYSLFFALTSSYWVASFGAGLSVMGLGFAMVYLFTFNRPSRQTVHDLAVESYVVRAEPKGAVVPSPFWKGHYVVFGCWAVVLALGCAGGFFLMRLETFANMLTLQQSFIDSGKVRTVNTTAGTSWVMINGRTSTSTSLTVDAWIPRTDETPGTAARELASLVLQKEPDAMGQGQLVVIVRQGYAIGIFSSWRSYRYSHTPEEWQKLIADKREP